jgi:diadenosine tetraphosphate (Ap4A) HIT family hydrolase
MNWEESYCLLCDLVYREPCVPFCTLFPSESAASQILLETPSFVVTPDIGPIVEGYCLVTSKTHIPAMSCLGTEDLDELQKLKMSVKEAMLAVYGGAIVFEHGEASTSRNAGACIDHAHLHIVPTLVDLSPSLVELPFVALSADFNLRVLGSNTGYLYYENQAGKAFLALVDRCEQQYFRRKLSKIVRPEIPWNWRDFIRYANQLETRSRIEQCMEKLRIPITRGWIHKNHARLL